MTTLPQRTHCLGRRPDASDAAGFLEAVTALDAVASFGAFFDVEAVHLPGVGGTLGVCEEDIFFFFFFCSSNAGFGSSFSDAAFLRSLAFAASDAGFFFGGLLTAVVPAASDQQLDAFPFL